MEPTLRASFEQFDNQANQPVFDHIELNNLYLAVERGEVELTILVGQRLQLLAGRLYNDCDFMREYWLGEFQTLPGWLEV